ncbi:MAG: peptidase C15 [Beijerinckiaceae bacterium]
MMRILITGFGPFPGAPTNPTIRLARHLGRVRRERFRPIDRTVRLLPTTWAMLDGVRKEVADIRPDAVLMLGLASRRRMITPEARAINQASILRTDAAGRKPFRPMLAPDAPHARPGTIDAARMAAALRFAGLPAAVSRNAGDYLCNGIFWRMLETGVPCIFVHVPRPVRPTLPKGRLKRPRPTMRDLERAAEIALAEVIARLP